MVITGSSTIRDNLASNPNRMETSLTDALAKLLEVARKITMTDAEREEQRISFAYGSAKIENDLVTEEMVRDAARRLKEESARQDG